MYESNASYVHDCIEELERDTTLRRATVYVNPRLTVKATRQHRFDKRERQETFIVTVGRPNYREREFIKLAKRAGEAFPIRQPQLMFWPKRRKNG